MSQSPSDLTAAVNTYVLNDSTKAELCQKIIDTIDNQLSDMEWVVANRKTTDTTQSYVLKPFTLSYDKKYFTDGLESSVRLHYTSLGWTNVVVSIDTKKLVSDVDSITINSILTGPL